MLQLFIVLVALATPALLLALFWSADSRGALLGFLELALRRFLVRFHPQPARTWVTWARAARRGALARAYIAEAARTGDPEGVLEEGLLYWEGGWGPGGREAAVSRFRRAAEAGQPDAMYWLAEDLRWGLSRPLRDREQALQWLREGARRGSGACMTALVSMQAAEADPEAREEAARWQARLEASGADPAPRRGAVTLGALPGSPTPLQRGLDEAAALTTAWFEHPSMRPVLPWLAWTAILLLLGGALLLFSLPFLFGGPFAIPLVVSLAILVPMGWRMRMENRPGEAVRKHLDLAQAGDPAAAYVMGMSVLKGENGMPRDPAEARRWLRRAARSGHLEAMVELAALLRWDLGGPRDPAEADHWLQVAAEAGSEEARRQLDRTPAVQAMAPAGERPG